MRPIFQCNDDDPSFYYKLSLGKFAHNLENEDTYILDPFLKKHKVFFLYYSRIDGNPLFQFTTTLPFYSSTMDKFKLVTSAGNIDIREFYIIKNIKDHSSLNYQKWVKNRNDIANELFKIHNISYEDIYNMDVKSLLRDIKIDGIIENKPI